MYRTPHGIVMDTKQFTDKYRTQNNNASGDFSECEVCRVKGPLPAGIRIKYYHRTGKIMCDRCIDNYDGATPWSDEYAKKYALPPYPGNYSMTRILKP